MTRRSSATAFVLSVVPLGVFIALVVLAPARALADCDVLSPSITVLAADEFHVAPNGVAPDDGDNLQAALDCVARGGTVIAGKGTHLFAGNQSVVIQHAVTLTGDGKRRGELATILMGGHSTVTVDAGLDDVTVTGLAIATPTLAGVQLLSGNNLIVRGLHITDIIPAEVDTILGPLVLGFGVWAHEAILSVPTTPRFHGSITISENWIRGFAFPSNENTAIAVTDMNLSAIPIIIADNELYGDGALFVLSTLGLVTPTTWIVNNRIDATSALGGISVRIHPAGVPGVSFIEDNHITGGFVGVLLLFAVSGGTTMVDNRIEGSFFGIALPASSGHIIEGTRIEDTEFGIALADLPLPPLVSGIPSNGNIFREILVNRSSVGIQLGNGSNHNLFEEVRLKNVDIPVDGDELENMFIEVNAR